MKTFFEHFQNMTLFRTDFCPRVIETRVKKSKIKKTENTRNLNYKYKQLLTLKLTVIRFEDIRINNE